METAEGTVAIEPDLQFIRDLSREGGETFKKCFQCGTCAATCPISPEVHPFPRKEMAWAAWGMRDRLLQDPDVWLCHRCNDCSVRCPRGARPGDVLAAVRREGVLHYATPRFLARWVSRPRYIPLLLGFPVVLLGLALLFKDRLAEVLGMAGPSGEPIVFSYSPMLPHWLLNSIFGLFGLFALLAAVASVVRFWRALKAGGTDPPVKGVAASSVSVIKRVVLHEKFLTCTTPHSRPLSHLCVFFGFLALTIVTLWVITIPVNPLIRSEFAYPFGFLNPWKVLANLGGIAVFVGCLLMIWDRLYDADNAGTSRFFDWALVWTLFAVVVTGFATELLHFLRMVPHRHVVYFVHLVCVFALLVYLPYSKFAHILYRVTAMVYAEHIGRDVGSGAESSVTSAEAAASGTSP
jgi:quinone-modifying oxidoreductase subunit QmoC